MLSYECHFSVVQGMLTSLEGLPGWDSDPGGCQQTLRPPLQPPTQPVTLISCSQCPSCLQRPPQYSDGSCVPGAPTTTPSLATNYLLLCRSEGWSIPSSPTQRCLWGGGRHPWGQALIREDQTSPQPSTLVWEKTTRVISNPKLILVLSEEDG